jgi:hypothetical protein
MPSETMHVWRADEDGCVQWWVVARTEDEARALLRDIELPNEDTEDFTIEQVPDDQSFTLTCPDDDPEPSDIPPGAVVTPRTPEKWPSVKATAGAFASLYARPGHLATSEY